MAQKITLTHTAEKNRLSILAYYAENSGSQAAAKIFEELENALNIISAFPYSGKTINQKGYRSFIVNPYGIIYKISDNSVIVLHFCDTRRNPKNAPYG